MGGEKNFFFIMGLLGVISILTQSTQGAQILTTDNCASFNQADISQPTLEAHNTVSEYLLQQGKFVRVVDGYAKLNTPVATGNKTGGGTNTDGDNDNIQ